MVWTILVTLHVGVCLLLILAVLLQQGKGASMGILSGASQTWFGPTGSKSLLMKITVGFACGFLALSVLLSLVTQRRPAPPPAAPPPMEAPAPGGAQPAPAPAPAAPAAPAAP